MLQWTTPMMLAGLGLLSLPIAAHLLNRKSTHTYFIPTIRFLQASSAHQNRFLKLRRWLLLLLRTLIVAAVVCMFARPVWWDGHNTPSNKDSVGMAIVIDRSLSTTQKIGNTHLFQSIRGSAIRSLNELVKGRDFATVVLADGSPEPLQRKLVPNIPGLKLQLQAIKSSLECANIHAAIAEASRQLTQFNGRRLLVIISDMQQSNWAEILNDPAQRFDLPPDTEVRFVSQDQRITENVALSNAQCDPPVPSLGQLATLSVTTSNFSDRVKQVPVSLFSGEEKLGDQILKIEPMRAATASFQVMVPQTNAYRFSIPSDNLEADNQAFVAVSTGKSIPITVISDDTQTEIGSSRFFLERAVRPFNNIRDRYQIRSLDTRSIKSGSFAGQQTVVVGYVSGWTNAAIDELLKFTKSGGNLVYLCGEGNVAGQLSRIEKRAETGCFPFQLVGLDRFDDFDDMPQIQSGKWRSRWLRDFDFSSQLALQQIRFNRVWSVGQIRAGAEVLMQYSDGRPVLGYSTYGNGTIVLVNLSPSVEFSEFGKFGSFAALIQIIVGQLHDQDPTSNQRLVGDSINFVHQRPTDGVTTKLINVVGPSGDELDVRIMKSEDSFTCLVDRTTEPGLYRLRSADEVLQMVSVATDPRESKLEYIDQVDLGSSLEGVESGAMSAGKFSLNLIDEGTPWWRWLAMGSIMMMASESFLLGWWKR